MSGPVKRIAPPNRLPECYQEDAVRLGISGWAVAQESWRWHENRDGERDGREVSEGFIRFVLKRRRPCPPWLRRQLDSMIADAENGGGGT
jgi:hypothetical protein